MNASLTRQKEHIVLSIYISKEERGIIVLGSGCRSKYEKEVQRANDILRAMRLLGEEETMEVFRKHFLGKTAKPRKRRRKPKSPSLLDEDFCAWAWREEMGAGHSVGYAKHVRCVLNAVKAHGKIRRIRDLTTANIVDWDKWLRKGKRTDITIYGYHKKIRTFVHTLVALRVVADPYMGIKIPKGRCKERRVLSEEEIEILRTADLSEPLCKARDLFIFECFTGISFTDIQALDYERDVVVRDGLPFVDGRRLKTSTGYFTPVLPPAQEIWAKYGYALPRLSLQKANTYLHAIRAALNIHTPLTTHVARHTFATRMLAENVPITSVAKMLGHTKLETTQIYAKVLESTIVKNIKGLNVSD